MEEKKRGWKKGRAEFFIFILDGKGWVEFGLIVFGLNEVQWVFSLNPIITGSNWVDAHLTQIIIWWVWVQLELVGLSRQMSLGLFCHPYPAHR